MCLKKGRTARCSLLDANPSNWSRYELLPAIAEVVDGLAHFETSIRLAAEGAVQQAREALLRVQSGAIQRWYIEHAQVAGARRLDILHIKKNDEKTVLKDKLAYPPCKLEAEIFSADGFRCRYCQRRVVTRRLLRLFHGVVGSASFSIGTTNKTTHGAALAYRAVVDHVVPRWRGGRTERSNLVTACYPCNFGKAEHSLEQLRLEFPRPALLDSWDGLESLVPALNRQAQQLERS